MKIKSPNQNIGILLFSGNINFKKSQQSFLLQQIWLCGGCGGAHYSGGPDIIETIHTAGVMHITCATCERFKDVMKMCFWMDFVSDCFSTWRTEPAGWLRPAGSGNCERGLMASGAAPAFSGRSCGLRQGIQTLKPSHMLLQRTCKRGQGVIIRGHTVQEHNRSTS